MCVRCTARAELIEKFRTRTEMAGEGFAVYFGRRWPGHAYTVGLTAMDHPELVAVGMSRWLLTEALSAIAADIRDGLLTPIADGGRARFGTWTFTVVAVPEPRLVLPRADAVYGRRLHALLLVPPRSRPSSA